MMSIMQTSPFMWATPELWYQLKDSKAEFAAGILTTLVAGGAYSIIGPAAAIKCIGFGATKSRLAAKALKLINNRNEPQQEVSGRIGGSTNAITVASSNNVGDRIDSGTIVAVR